jgi:Probable cobalt transporter subunit (CbtB)
MQQLMTGTVALPRPAPRALPAPISLREVWPWALFGLFLLLLLYFVVGDQGAVSVVPGMYVHEFVHDGRHLLSFPCH